MFIILLYFKLFKDFLLNYIILYYFKLFKDFLLNYFKDL